jgi:hypothetical protein
MPNPEIQRRIRRWENLYAENRSIRRLFMIRFGDPVPDRPLPVPENKNKRIEWAWLSYQRKIQQTEWLKDDSIPYLDVYTGTEIFSHAFGCKVCYQPDGFPFASHRIQNASEVKDVKVPDWSSTHLADLFEIADELRRRAGKDAVVRIPDIQSPMDIAALIWDKNEFFPAMVQDPQAVKDLAAKVKELLMSFADAWFARYGKSFVAHCPDYYLPAGFSVSEDEVGAVNEKMFEELFLPELAELSNHYGGLGMHCCANSRHQWQNFKKIPNLKLLNINQPVPLLREAYSFFADHTVQMHGWYGDGPAGTWPSQLPPNARYVIEAYAKTKEEALNLCEKLTSNVFSGNYLGGTASRTR